MRTGKLIGDWVAPVEETRINMAQRTNINRMYVDWIGNGRAEYERGWVADRIEDIVFRPDRKALRETQDLGAGAFRAVYP